MSSITQNISTFASDLLIIGVIAAAVYIYQDYSKFSKAVDDYFDINGGSSGDPCVKPKWYNYLSGYGIYNIIKNKQLCKQQQEQQMQAAEDELNDPNSNVNRIVDLIREFLSNHDPRFIHTIQYDLSSLNAYEQSVIQSTPEWSSFVSYHLNYYEDQIDSSVGHIFNSLSN